MAAAAVAAAMAMAVAALLCAHVFCSSGIRAPAPLAWPAPRSWLPPPGNALEHAMAKLGIGQLPGAEDMAVDGNGDWMYLACRDGWIRRFSLHDNDDDHIRVENWTYVGGRPLGIVAGTQKDEEMLVCEPEKGLLSVTKGKVEVLSAEAGGFPYKLADGVDVTADGTVYFTDASTTFTLHYFDLDLLEGRPTGRLLRYDPRTRETSVLVQNLYFPNGVALSENEDFLLICETGYVRLQRYWLQGDKRGTLEVFIDNLPGFPDNVHRSGRVFWVALLGGRSAVWEALLRVALVKHIAAYWRLLLYYLNNSYARVMAVSEDATPLLLHESLQSKSINFLTTALQHKDALYVGTLTSNYIGKLNLTRLGA